MCNKHFSNLINIQNILGPMTINSLYQAKASEKYVRGSTHITNHVSLVERTWRTKEHKDNGVCQIKAATIPGSLPESLWQQSILFRSSELLCPVYLHWPQSNVNFLKQYGDKLLCLFGQDWPISPNTGFLMLTAREKLGELDTMASKQTMVFYSFFLFLSLTTTVTGEAQRNQALFRM